MRIVSLLPAATEWLFAMGAGAEVVGRSHACDVPPGATALPACTDPQGRLLTGGVEALRPDLVVMEDPHEFSAALAGAAVFAFAPVTYKQVLDRALALGRAVGRMTETMRLLGDGEARLRALHRRIGLTRPERGGEGRPRVAVLEGIDPPRAAGRWVPDLGAQAGGRPVLSEAGQPSAPLDETALLSADPEVLVIAVSGRPLEAAMQDVSRLAERPGWSGLRAVADGRVFVTDGQAYVNRPGPRLVRAVELLAAAIHGEKAGVTAEPEALRRVVARPATGA